MNLTDEQFTAWMAALRSNKFHQTRHVLTSPLGYCCMGVAGKVCFNMPDGKMEGRCYLSDIAAEGQHFSHSDEVILSQLNDNERLTFYEIAAFVEAGGLDLCKEAYESD